MNEAKGNRRKKQTTGQSHPQIDRRRVTKSEPFAAARSAFSSCFTCLSSPCRRALEFQHSRVSKSW